MQSFRTLHFGRESVNVDTDHQPLEMIVRKPLNTVPKQQLQKYSLVVHYKKGTQMYLADTLSRAHLPEVQACELALKLLG